MKYQIEEITIEDLYNLIKNGKLDLRPPYQRNFIWSKNDQQLLIDSIEKGYPLPSFFIFSKPDGTFEMVDGQQRAETICRFIKGHIKDANKCSYNDIDRKEFLSYKLNVTKILSVDDTKNESIATFYALVNKQGEHLNRPEINKAQYFDSPFLSLVEELLSSEELSELDIFTAKTKDRMNDRALLEELIAYLEVGFYDKREAVNDLFKSELSKDKINDLRNQFNDIIGRIVGLNQISPINKTRYRQRNDFFTLFSFIKQHGNNISDKVLTYQYDILRWIDKNDMIRPSNEIIELLQKYAYACVTQSNSKRARETRLTIFEQLLLNKKNNNNEDYERFIEDLRDYFNCEDIPHVQIGEYWLIDINNLSYDNEE